MPSHSTLKRLVFCVKFIYLTLIFINVISSSNTGRKDVIKKFMKLSEGASTIFNL
jgi:hypothetical protein